MRYSATWKGFDRGRERSYDHNYWLGVLQILAAHEGESLRDETSPVYTDLALEFPETAWIGADSNRNFFRGYQSPWTLSGVMSPTVSTEGKILITPLGRALLDDKITNRAVWVQAMTTLQESDSNEKSFTILARAFLDVGARVLSLFDIYWGIECNWRPGDGPVADSLSSAYPPLDDHATPVRRLRAMLKVLVEHGLIEQTDSGWRVLSTSLLQAIADGNTVDLDLPNHTQEASLAGVKPESNTEKELAILAEEAADVSQPIREIVMRAIAVRRGQPKFRRQLLNLYQGRCAISQYNAESALEAAHIVPFAAEGSHQSENGLLLRADLHTLFDLHYIAINPDQYSVVISSQLGATRYAAYQGHRIHLPMSLADYPSVINLRNHFEMLET